MNKDYILGQGGNIRKVTRFIIPKDYKFIINDPETNKKYVIRKSKKRTLYYELQPDLILKFVRKPDIGGNFKRIRRWVIPQDYKMIINDPKNNKQYIIRKSKNGRNLYYEIEPNILLAYVKNPHIGKEKTITKKKTTTKKQPEKELSIKEEHEKLKPKELSIDKKIKIIEYRIYVLKNELKREKKLYENAKKRIEEGKPRTFNFSSRYAIRYGPSGINVNERDDFLFVKEYNDKIKKLEELENKLKLLKSGKNIHIEQFYLFEDELSTIYNNLYLDIKELKKKIKTIKNINKSRSIKELIPSIILHGNIAIRQYKKFIKNYNNNITDEINMINKLTRFIEISKNKKNGYPIYKINESIEKHQNTMKEYQNTLEIYKKRINDITNWIDYAKQIQLKIETKQEEPKTKTKKVTKKPTAEEVIKMAISAIKEAPAKEISKSHGFRGVTKQGILTKLETIQKQQRQTKQKKEAIEDILKKNVKHLRYTRALKKEYPKITKEKVTRINRTLDFMSQLKNEEELETFKYKLLNEYK